MNIYLSELVKLKRIAGVVVAIALTACGGGGSPSNTPAPGGVGSPSNTPAPPSPNQTASRLELVDHDLSGFISSDGPGATVLIMKDNEVIFRKAYGMANIEQNVAMRPEMTLRVGSVTKQFTSAAIMLLADEGKLSEKDDIRKHLPDFPDKGAVITIENLMTHTSGIPEYLDLAGYPLYGDGWNKTTRETIDFFKDKSLDFEPGTKWSYSNSGYLLLDAIIEKVSGVPYATFMRERIFKPLGMNNSFIVAGGVQSTPEATGYVEDPQKVFGLGTRFVVPNYNLKHAQSDGGMRTNVDDMAIWNLAYVQAKLLKTASWLKMTTPYVLQNGQSTQYGYGLGIRKAVAINDPNKFFYSIQHAGGIPGWNAMTEYFPIERLYIVVLSNTTAASPGNRTAAGSQISSRIYERLTQ